MLEVGRESGSEASQTLVRLDADADADAAGGELVDAPCAGADVCYGGDVVCWDGGVDGGSADEVDEEAMLFVEAVLLVGGLLG